MRDQTEQDQDLDRSKTSGASTIGVDLKHPPKGVELLCDTDKRFLAGMVRESYVQGLNECRRNKDAVPSRDTGFKLADQWIESSIPFLGNIIGDVGTGAPSNR